MRRNDSYYFHLLHECQADDLKKRLEALDGLRRHQYLDLVEQQFLLDRLNSTSEWQEWSAILGLMCQLDKPLPIDSLVSILADWETTSVHLRMDVARVLVSRKAEEAFDLVLRLVLDQEEHPWLREALTLGLVNWKERITDDLLLTLLADPQPAVCTAALEVLRQRAPQAIPLDLILPHLQRDEKYIREEAIKTLAAAEQHAPVEAILAALHDPETEVREAASRACMDLVEWFSDQMPLDELLQALQDEYAGVRENILDTLGKIPLRIPVEPVIAALADPIYFVRCAAIETLGLMGERVPSSIYPRLQEMAGNDSSAHVRQRATRTLLLLHGITPAPLRMPTIEITLEELERREIDELPSDRVNEENEDNDGS